MQDFDRLYREHAPHVRRFALHLCGEAAQADDITAETFVRVWATRASLRHATVRAFLFAIARNLFVTGVRASWRRVPLEDVHADPAPGPLARAESRAEADALARALAQLTPEDREALVLRAQEALSYAEIAQILGTSEGAVKVRVHRARKRLLSLMDRSAGPPSSGGRP